MYFAFIDESGYPKPSENDARPVLVSTCIRDNDIRRITQRLHNASIECFGEDTTGKRQLKGKKMIEGRSLTPNYNNRTLLIRRLLGFPI